MTTARCDGVFAPVITPFTDSLEIDYDNWLRHCRWLQNQGAGLAVFGTNSEAASLGLDEKQEALERLVEGGIDPSRLMPGTGACALPDTVTLTRQAVSLGSAGVLMLPPYYYKNVSDDGLYSYFAEVIDRVGDGRLRIYLYHIPAVSGVAITHTLIEKLARAFPDQIAGIKDSSGDAGHLARLNDLQLPDFRVFCGSESLLLDNLRQGGAGCISATANVNPRPIRALFEDWQDEGATARQQRLNGVRELFQRYPMIPALKAAVGEYSANAGWLRVRPPLLPLLADSHQRLLDELRTIGFQMSDI